VVSAVLLASVGCLKAKARLRQISARCVPLPVLPRFFFAHCGAMVAFCVLSRWLFRNHSAGLETGLLAVGWVATGLLAIGLAAFAFAPRDIWWAAFRATGNLWIYALLAGVLASLLGKASQLLWGPATHMTFILVKTMLRLFVPGATADSATSTIGTEAFNIEISPRCSGLEGIGLMVAMGALWLWLFRRDFRFPQAALLIPAGVTILYFLNSVRIVALILIGNAGAPDIAVRGFHSQAGWIAFNSVALILLMAAPRIPWFAARELAASEVAASELTADVGYRPSGEAVKSRVAFAAPETRSADPKAYLLPFVILLAAGMLATAASGDFEWLYPLRFLAAAVTLAVLWRKYTVLKWRVDWLAPAAGAIVFLVWIGLDGLGSALPAARLDIMPLPLAAASSFGRDLWLTFRVLAATVTVPLAEELAFRGFLYRRLLSSEFQSVSFRRFSWLALLISSAVFGLLHGDRWFVGSVAGAIYTLVLNRRGSMGDAVAAHATTNALLTVDVLAFGHWHLW